MAQLAQLAQLAAPHPGDAVPAPSWIQLEHSQQEFTAPALLWPTTMQETLPSTAPSAPSPCPALTKLFLFIELCPLTGIWEVSGCLGRLLLLTLASALPCLWRLLAGLGWVPLKVLFYKFLVFPRSKRQIADLPKPSSSQSLLCCSHLMSQSLYSSELPQPEMSLMDPLPSAWKINAWTGLWCFCAAGDGWNSSCAASALASSSFALKCLFLFCLEGRWMLLGAGAAFSQSPGNSYPVHAGFSSCATPETPETQRFVFSPPLPILRRVPAWEMWSCLNQIHDP